MSYRENEKCDSETKYWIRCMSMYESRMSAIECCWMSGICVNWNFRIGEWHGCCLPFPCWRVHLRMESNFSSHAHYKWRTSTSLPICLNDYPSVPRHSDKPWQLLSVLFHKMAPKSNTCKLNTHQTVQTHPTLTKITFKRHWSKDSSCKVRNSMLTKNSRTSLWVWPTIGMVDNVMVHV